jgi:hippurate hydrolase
MSVTPRLAEEEKGRESGNEKIPAPLREAQGEIAEWRRDFHRHPEILYDVGRTAGIVAAKLREFGCDEVAEGVGQSGVVGVIKGRQSGGEVIGMRADMDALPMTELNDFPHKSSVPGRMHGCGHDGHTAMLLGAARYLAEYRNFDGAVALIFQPAEEGGAGGLAMVKDGLMERFAIRRVFGMHNMPGIAVGEFALREGAIMAAADFFDIEITGGGGHAAMPHRCADPVVAGGHLVCALQTLASRRVDPVDSAVVSVCEFHAGEAHNVLPETAVLRGTARALKEATRDLLAAKMEEMCEGVGKLFGVKVKFNYRRLYPCTINDPQAARFAATVAAQVAAAVDAETPPLMAGEDFSFMLQERPGAFIFVGNGDTPGVHHPRYDFNDEAIPYGCAFWTRLAESALPLKNTA